MNLRVALLAGLAVLAVTVGVGCGGGDDVPEAASAPTRAEFVRQANAICAKMRADLEEEVATFLDRQQSAKPPAELHADVAQFVLMPMVEQQMEGVRALRPPTGDERRVQTMLGAMELGISAVATAARIPSIAAVERRFARADRLLRAYGLPACVNGSGRLGGAS